MAFTKLFKPKEFEYTTSLAASKEPCIRLLEVHQRTGKTFDPGKVQVTLKEYKFDDSLPAYHALSYAWGNSPIQKTIECNGKPFKIGIVLWEALWWFSHPKHYQYRLLWIDRLCR